MRARILIVAFGALSFAACADRPFEPIADPIVERIAPSLAGAHLSQQFRITPVALDFGQVEVGTSSPEQFVVVTNVGHGSVVMAGTGGAAGVFGGIQNCQGSTLAEGASCIIAYSFTPTATGPVEVTAAGTWNEQPYSIQLRGEGIPSSRFSISPAALDFGQVDVGGSSAPQSVTITNLGPGPIVMDGTGGAAGVFGGTQNCQGVTLAEGASCEMTYVFNPTTGGVAQATAAGTWNGHPYSIELRGEGLQTHRFAMTPTAFDFGEVHVGGFAFQLVNVTNLGPGPVLMNGTMGPLAGFGSMQTCQGVTLAEGAACQMYFTLQPQTPGELVATATGDWNGQSYSVSLRAMVLEAGAARTKRFLIATRGLDFGQLNVGATSEPQSITVTNLGPGSVVMNGTGGTAASFSLAQSCQGMTLLEGQSCQMMYRFTPTANGAVEQVATGTWNGEEYSIALSGYGMQRQRFLITPTAHDFGGVRVGESSGEHVIRVTNLGPGLVVMDGTGGAAGEFGGTQNCQGVALIEGAYCEMSYRFTPTAEGEVVRTTSGSWNGQPFSFTFRGAGVVRDRFLISPTGFDFGEVELGTSAPEQSVTITNVGPGPITMDGTGGAAGLFGGVQNCQGVTLEEGGTCTMSYSFTPSVAGVATASTGGTWNGQPYELSFHGVGIPPISADIKFGGFLPPFNQRPKLLPGMTLPVKARLLDASGLPLPDEEALALVEACAVIVTFSAVPDEPLCARYDVQEKHFVVNLRMPRLIALGVYRVALRVRVNDALVTVGEADVEIRGR